MSGARATSSVWALAVWLSRSRLIRGNLDRRKRHPKLPCFLYPNFEAFPPIVQSGQGRGKEGEGGNGGADRVARTCGAKKIVPLCRCRHVRVTEHLLILSRALGAAVDPLCLEAS